MKTFKSVTPGGICKDTDSNEPDNSIRLLSFGLMFLVFWALGSLSYSAEPSTDLSVLANKYRQVHRFSTLFTAQDVKNHLSTEAGLNKAIEWCRNTGVTKVYIESYRDGYSAETDALINARYRFKKEGFDVSGCVTTTKIGKPSTGWNGILSCYTDKETQEITRKIFERAASLFDEVMIDDFWFTDCACTNCESARKAKKFTIGNTEFNVADDKWGTIRCELMCQMSRLYVIEAGRKINPKVKFIIKYPQWYDRFHERGYDVIRETALFDKIWVGTETRDYTNKRWGGTVQYEGYFIMRWLGSIGGKKCGGGWYDWLGTTENTYIEQARQTILAGARESFLFCYGGLQRDTGPKNIETLRQNLPELFKVASEVKKRDVIGVYAYKPANSPPENELYVFDFVGMLGIPLVPCHNFPDKAKAGFFSVHCLKDPQFIEKFSRFISSGRPALITDGLANKLQGKIKIDLPGVTVLKVGGNPKGLLQMPQEELDKIRAPLLKPFKTTFKAPNKVASYLFDDGSYVVENFNDEDVEVEVNSRKLSVKSRGWIYEWK